MNNEIITICIPTTPERNERLKELLQSIHENTEGMKYRVLFYPNNDGGWVPAVHNMLEGIDGFVVLLGSDVVVKKDWLKNLWEAFIKQFPKGDGVAQPYDEINGGGLCQHPLGHARTIREYLDKDFIHNFSDNWMTERLIEDGKYLYVPEALIEHKHFINKKAPKDKTYETVFSTFERDREVYNRKCRERDSEREEDEDGDNFIVD